MRLESRNDFEAFREEARTRATTRKSEILVCCGTGCLASGSAAVAEGR